MSKYKNNQVWWKVRNMICLKHKWFCPDEWHRRCIRSHCKRKEKKTVSSFGIKWIKDED